MLAIRLKRVGRSNDPSFRIIVQDHRRSPKKTRGVAEYVGSYDARKGTPQINGERVKYWISQGAQPSDTVHNLLVDAKIITSKKVNALNKKTPVVKEVPKEVEKKVAPVVVAAPVVAEVVAPVVAEEPKAEESKAEEPKVEEPKAEVAPAPVAEEPKAEEPKAETAPAPEAVAETPAETKAE